MDSYLCEVCNSEYNTTNHIPKVVITCGHTVCISCISTLFNEPNPKCPMDCINITVPLEKLPTNTAILQLLEDKKNRELCAQHNEAFTLICLTDKRIICRLCAEYGNHQGHRIKVIKDLKEFDVNLKKIRVSNNEILTLCSVLDELTQLTNVKLKFPDNITTEHLCKLWSHAYWKRDRLRHLHFSVKHLEKINNEYFMKLMKFALSSMKNLESLCLNLSDTRTTDESITCFAHEILPLLPNLKNFKLNLSNTLVTDISLSQLCESINKFMSNSPESFALKLKKTMITDDTIKQLSSSLAGSLKNIKKLELDFAWTMITDKGLQALANEGFLRMTSLEDFTLDAGENFNIKDQYFQLLFSSLATSFSKSRNNSFKSFTVKLKETNLTDNSIKQLSLALAGPLKNVKKLELNFAATQITDKGLQTLGNEGLLRMTSIEEFILDVEENPKITEQGFDLLYLSLKTASNDEKFINLRLSL